MTVRKEPTGTPAISKITYETGEVRYRLLIEATPDPSTGKRRQVCRTFRKLADAEAERGRIVHEKRRNTYVHDRKVTVADALAEHLDALEPLDKPGPSTMAEYRRLALPLNDAFGARQVTALTHRDVQNLVKRLKSGELRRYGDAPLAAGTIKQIVGLLARALDDLVAAGELPRNVARLVKLPELPELPDRAWTVDETRTFLAAAADYRLHACWQLSTLGLRLGEVLGLEWDHIDWQAGTLRIARSKTKHGRRTLPLPQATRDVLAALHDLQEAEASLAGSVYSDSGHVAVDEFGAPLREWVYQRQFQRIARQAGLRRIRLHDLRHGAATYMIRGLKLNPFLAAEWLGHSDPSLTLQVYVDSASSDDLAAIADQFGTLLDPER